MHDLTNVSPAVVWRTLHPASPCCSSWPSLPSCFTDCISHSDSDKSRKDPAQPTRYEQWIILKIWKRRCSRAFFCGSRNSLTLQPPIIFSATTPALCSKWSEADPDKLMYHNPHNESEFVQSWSQYYPSLKSWKLLLMGHRCTSCGSKSGVVQISQR